jgi:hypothetical protein
MGKALAGMVTAA